MQDVIITPEQSRAARASLGLSQAFIAKETGINRSQLALFEVGRYQLEPYKRMALRDCYRRLGYPLDGEAISPAPVKPLPKPGTPSPQVVDGLLVGKGFPRETIETIRDEIARNDESIAELAQKPFERELMIGPPMTRERDAILRLMARNYQLVRYLLGRALLPLPASDAQTSHTPDPRTSGDLAAALLASPKALKNGS